MADPEAIVSAFIAEFDAEHPSVPTLLSYFSDDAVYHNMPGPPLEGIAAIEKGLNYTQQMSSRGWEVVHQAVSGNVVINERIDRFEVGGKPVELPVVGVFEINDDGKITAWRDYFDMAFFQKQMPS
jgi:limonene-1,2-epoxide hydrolase